MVLQDQMDLGTPRRMIKCSSCNIEYWSRANSSKGKHINVNYHYIQDIVEMGEIKIHFVPSVDMMADPMTKGLTLNQFRVHVIGMRLRGNSVELYGSARSDGPGDA